LTLYSKEELAIHLEDGDFGKNDNLLVYHPKCKFCSKFFYDIPSFSLHLKTAHEFCNVCKNQHKYRFYRDYDMLKKHFEASHHSCNYTRCKEVGFVVFASKEELDYHIVIAT